MKEIGDHLRQFNPVDLDEEASFDASQANQLQELLTRLAKGQWKTQQKAGHAAQKVTDYLDEHSDRVTELKEERATLQDREEQYQRVFLEIMDLFDQLDETARRSDSDAFQSTVASAREKLASTVGKVGLERIPAEGKALDSLYHHVVDTTKADMDTERDTIVEVVRPGYLLQGEVLRKADVIVAK